MNLLITCHKPPGFGHPSVFQLNTNAFKRNKTRKYSKNLRDQGYKVFYLDTESLNTFSDGCSGKACAGAGGESAKPPINFYQSWAAIPDESMDIIWMHHCPSLEQFFPDEIHFHLTMFEDPRDQSFISDYNRLWEDVLKHGHRILKKGGKIIMPLEKGGLPTENITEILLIMRILNLEVLPEYLYKLDILDALSEKHKTSLRNLYVTNTTTHIPKFADTLFLIFEKHTLF